MDYDSYQTKWQQYSMHQSKNAIIVGPLKSCAISGSGVPETVGAKIGMALIEA